MLRSHSEHVSYIPTNPILCLQLAIIWERILEVSSQVKEVKLGKVTLPVNQIANLSLSKCR